MKLRLLSLLAFVILLNACISIKVESGNSYGSLSQEQKSHIKKFVPGQPLHDTTSVFTLYEIMPDQLRKEAANAGYTCYFSQVPHCDGPHCKPLTYYSRLLASLDSMQVKTFLVSPCYDYSIMQKEKERFAYEGLMFVEDRDSRSHKFSGHKQFIEEVLGHKVRRKDMLWYASYYVFRGDSLVSYGLEQADAVDYIRAHRQ